MLGNSTAIVLRQRLVTIIDADLADALPQFGAERPANFIVTDRAEEAETYEGAIVVDNGEDTRADQTPEWVDAGFRMIVELWVFDVTEDAARDLALRMRSAICSLLRKRSKTEHAYFTGIRISNDGTHRTSEIKSPALFYLPLTVTLYRRVSIQGTGAAAEYPDM